ncbi:oxidoreductase [Streptomyces capillispiralis]|uniref:NADH:flavin oxidoreductase/NADH oxidase family protein n=1 Tax=Streptomyces capillispiralis TaxID=68182 RepID=A0A561TS03_9ACTN|nr:hypothetical protein [Streptomyces capillispiralis]TWF89895.1 NADH:flavin oxidoreductase/NADH oxidase family protein [Streptomyces capillispiralis]GHH95721.1 hypothetical protein GCM10017779_61780 [Streptomyces capillispiralis]
MQGREDFVTGARRAQQAGFDGVESHGAFGFVIAQRLSRRFNRRTDRYGGDIEGRSCFPLELFDGVRGASGPYFQRWMPPRWYETS